MADIELSHVNMSIMLLQKRMTGALVTTVRFMRKKIIVLFFQQMP